MFATPVRRLLRHLSPVGLLRSTFSARRLALLVVWCVFGAAVAHAQAPAAAPGRPNVLVILTDDQRWDALGVVQREMGKEALFPG